MNVLEFRRDFLQDVFSLALVEQNGRTDAFVSKFTDYLETLEIVADVTRAFFKDRGLGNKLCRVDGYAYTAADNTFKIIVSDYEGSDDPSTLTATDAQTLFKRVNHFLEYVYKGNIEEKVDESSEVADMISDLKMYESYIHKFQVILITDKKKSERIHSLEEGVYDNKPVEYHIWDMARLWNMVYAEDAEKIEIDFREYLDGEGIPYLKASQLDNGVYESYLCVVPGHLLADLYDKYGSRLLEGNIRSFLSTKMAVNKEIQHTILKAAQNFFAFNNGVAITAKHLVFETINGISYIVGASDFQIINGGQTTASLSNCRYKYKNSLKGIFVQMKLTEILDTMTEAEEAKLVENISRSSNSQNKVTKADFFSNHQFHVQMERYSRTLYAKATDGLGETKWYYERTRGQYLRDQMNKKQSEINEFQRKYPKTQVLTKTDFAKYRASWEGYPHMVSRGAQTNFVDFAGRTEHSWTEHATEFNEAYYRETIALAILFKTTEKIVSASAWYQEIKAYRANIVTYTVALLHHLINKQFHNQRFNLHKIWEAQNIPTSLQRILNELAEKVCMTIMDERSRETANITQWCKRENCWSKCVKHIDYKLPPAFDTMLIHKYEDKKIKEEAKEECEFVNEVQMQSYIIEKEASYWRALVSFVQTMHLDVSEWDMKALQIATKLPYQIPDGRQAKRIINVEKKAMYEGFNV